MKTAMQQYIERQFDRFQRDKALYEKYQQSDNLRVMEKYKGMMYASRDAWKEACTMLQTEKEQIMEAANYNLDDFTTPEAYYTQTFNQK